MSVSSATPASEPVQETERAGLSFASVAVRVGAALALLLLLAAALLGFGPASIASAIGLLPEERFEDAIRALALAVASAALVGFGMVLRSPAGAAGESEGASASGSEAQPGSPLTLTGEPGAALTDAGMPASFDTARAALHEAGLFRGIQAETLDLLAANAVERQFGPNEVLFSQGDPGEEAFIIAEGEADVLASTRHGRDVALNTLGPGATVGEMAVLLSGRPRSATVRARGELRVYALSAAVLRAATRSDTALAASLSSRMQQLGADAFLKMASPFVQLPASAIYDLAGKMRGLTLDAGAVLVRQNEPGDTF